jgi:hypothetical protein
MEGECQFRASYDLLSFESPPRGALSRVSVLFVIPSAVEESLTILAED